MTLEIRDTLTGKVEPVDVVNGGPLRLYVCGPTVYDRAHIGHGRTYLYFDIARRYFRARNIPVRHVMNITDFEDKITQRARDLGMSWQELGRAQETSFLEQMDRLGVLRPHVVPRASEFVPPMIRVIQRLERMGRIHRSGDEWIFQPRGRADGRNFPVGQELAEHAVPEPDHSFVVRGPNDREFMVWKRQEAPDPSWPSPWGNGMPGWHVECFTMAERFLGLPVDLHGGGTDLIYPHHYAENELTLALASRLFSRRFLHTAFVTENGRKMSKSIGLLVPLSDALDRYGRDALRFYLLGRPYHVRLEWSESEAERAKALLEDVQRRVREAMNGTGSPRIGLERLRALRQGMIQDVGTELSIDRALERLLTWAKTLGSHSTVESGSRSQTLTELQAIADLTGIPLLTETAASGGRSKNRTGPRGPRPRATKSRDAPRAG